MPFEFIETDLPPVKLIKPRKFSDERGYFLETFKQTDFVKNGIDYSFLQDNISYSTKGVLRGIHFQTGKHSQGKLVEVVAGRIFDVAVDLREDSVYYGKHAVFTLSSENHEMLWIPPGFGHAFQAIDNSLIHYKATSEYAPNAEQGIIWNDPDIGIDWPILPPILSEKDLEWGAFKNE